jgi:hypothetical protein
VLRLCVDPGEQQMDPGAGSQPSLSFSVLSSSDDQECVLDSHTTPIHDVAWAPVMGRSYHLIATASRERYFKVHLQRPHLLCVCLTLPSSLFLSPPPFSVSCPVPRRFIFSGGSMAPP